MLDLLSQGIVQVSFIMNSIICTCVEIVVKISGFFFRIRCRCVVQVSYVLFW